MADLQRVQQRRHVGHLLIDSATSLAGCLLVFSVAICFSVSESIIKSRSATFALWLPNLFIIILLAISIVIMVRLLCITHHSQGYSRQHFKDMEFFDIIKMFFQLVFAFGFIIFEGFGLTSGSDCIASWMTCDNISRSVYRVLVMILQIVRIIYVVVTVIFCLTFDVKQFLQSRWIRYQLAFLLAAALSLWFDSVVAEASIAIGHNDTRYTNIAVNDCIGFPAIMPFNSTFRVIKEHDVRCFDRTTDKYQLFNDAAPYLYPLVVEFILLYAENIITWYWETFPKKRPVQAQRAPQADGLATDDVDDDLLIVTDSEDEDSESDDGEPLVEFPKSFVFPSIVAVTIAVIINVLLYYSSIGKYYYHVCNVDQIMYVVLQIVHYSLLIISAAIGTRLSWEFYTNKRERSSPPKAFEYFVLLCTLGPLFYCGFTFLANVGTGDDKCPTYLCTVEEALNWFQIIVQTAYYFYAKGVDLRGGRPSRAKHVFLGTLLIYALSNLFVWGEDSFIETHNVQEMFQYTYYTGNTWLYMYFTFTPLAIMYRVNNFLLFISLWYKQIKQSSRPVIQ